MNFNKGIAQMNLENKITIRELRTVLFNIQDQDMTVRELRSILFGMNGQDETVPYSLISGIYNQNKKNAQDIINTALPIHTEEVGNHESEGSCYDPEEIRDADYYKRFGL